MKFSVDQKSFASALKDVAPACAKGALPILSCVEITADAEKNRLALYGTSLDWSVEVTMTAEVEEGGVAVAPHDVVEKTARNAAGDRVDVRTTAKKLHLTSGGANGSVTLANPDEMPARIPAPTAPGITLSGAALVDALASVQHAVSTDDSRPTFCGVRVWAEGGALHAVATDGHRLALVQGVSLAGEGETLHGGTVIGRALATHAARVIAPTAEATLAVEGDRIQITQADVTLTGTAIPGDYPDVARVLPDPQQSKAVATLPADALLGALKRAAPYTSKSGNVRLTVCDEGVVIHAQNEETGAEYDETLDGEDVKTTGKDEVSYCAQYLADAVKMLGSVVEIHTNGGGAPTMARPATRDATTPRRTCVVMPLAF